LRGLTPKSYRKISALPRDESNSASMLILSGKTAQLRGFTTRQGERIRISAAPSSPTVALPYFVMAGAGRTDLFRRAKAMRNLSVLKTAPCSGRKPPWGISWRVSCVSARSNAFLVQAGPV